MTKDILGNETEDEVRNDVQKLWQAIMIDIIMGLEVDDLPVESLIAARMKLGKAFQLLSEVLEATKL